MSEITLTEDRKIDKIVLSFNENLQKYFLQEAPSTELVDGALPCHWQGKEDMIKIAHVREIEGWV